METWQMTLSEFTQFMKGKPVEKYGYYNRQGGINCLHRHAVEGATQLGKLVPTRVLIDYPHIK